MSGILIATLVVGGIGLFIGLFLGIAAIKFKVQMDEREVAVLRCPAIAAADAATRAVPGWRLPSRKARRR